MTPADYSYCQAFGYDARQSPAFPGPSRTSPSTSTQSDSDSSFQLSPFSPTALLSPSPPATQHPLEEKRIKVIAECAPSPPVVRDAVYHILHSPEWEAQQEVNGDLLMPIVEAVHFPNGGRSGSRGGIDRYRCLFGACAKVIKRRDHMLNHVRCHLGLKPWVCGFASMDKQWSGSFISCFTLSLLTCYTQWDTVSAGGRPQTPFASHPQARHGRERVGHLPPSLSLSIFLSY
jgi:hypothetical protein